MVETHGHMGGTQNTMGHHNNHKQPTETNDGHKRKKHMNATNKTHNNDANAETHGGHK